MTIFSKLTSAFKSLPFSGYGGSGYGGGAAYIPGVSLTGSGFPGAGLPGTNYDYRSAAGVLWQNPSAAACFVALTKAFAQSRPVLERREGKAWQQVDEHALLDLLNVPNEFYSGERLFGVTLISTMANGAGYWRIERDRKGDPAELWFEPPTGVGPTGIAPAWDEEHFIREYFYFIDGKRHGEPLPRQDVVYFRHGLNPANSREPWAPLSLAAREIATLNSASTYTGALLRNSAVPSGMVTLEGSSLASGTPPTPEQAEEMKRRIKAGFKGDQVGEPFVSSLPWKWTPFNWSPEQLNISKLQTWPQGMVCALLGTPEIVALLPTGEQPTYQNLAASMEWWWNNTVIPLEDAFADEIETQLFPAFGLDRHEYRLTWDRSQVPALQEDEIAKHQMVREDYRAGVIDLFTATVQLGGEAVEDMRGVYHPSAAPKGGREDSTKAVNHRFSESDWVRDEGRFHRYVGGRLEMPVSVTLSGVPSNRTVSPTDGNSDAERAHRKVLEVVLQHDIFSIERKKEQTKNHIDHLSNMWSKVPLHEKEQREILNRELDNTYNLQLHLEYQYQEAEQAVKQAMDDVLQPTAKLDLVQPKLQYAFSDQEKENIQQAYEAFSSVIHRSDVKPSVVPITRGDSTYYYPKNGTIYVREGENSDSIIHELGHWLELQNHNTTRSAIEFLLRRNAKNPPRLLKEVYTGRDYTDEQFLPDEFAEAYVGRFYLNVNGDIGATEITSYGLQRFFKNPHSFASADPEHFQFVYNVLRGNI